AATTQQQPGATAVPASKDASATSGTLRKLADVRRGAVVRLRAPDLFAGRLSGEVLAVYPDQIEVRLGRRRRKIPFDAIESMDLKRRSAFGSATALWGGAGSVFGAVIGFFVAPWISDSVACSGTGCDDRRSGSSARLGSVTGSILGLVAGMAVGHRLLDDTWDPVDLPAIAGP
ncbi:MAG: hypothetical protein V3T05_12395, partial [Myxococcota bacterium]